MGSGRHPDFLLRAFGLPLLALRLLGVLVRGLVLPAALLSRFRPDLPAAFQSGASSAMASRGGTSSPRRFSRAASRQSCALSLRHQCSRPVPFFLPSYLLSAPIFISFLLLIFLLYLFHPPICILISSPTYLSSSSLFFLLSYLPSIFLFLIPSTLHHPFLSSPPSPRRVKALERALAVASRRKRQGQISPAMRASRAFCLSHG